MTKLQHKVRSFHGQWGLIFVGTAHLTLLTLWGRCRFSAMVKPCSQFYLLYFPGSKLHVCWLQYSPPSMSSRTCCIFLWNTSGAKHNLNGSLRKLCLIGGWMLNVCKHVLCFCKGTSQIPADASSAEKYLAPVSSPKIYPVVGSGKMCRFQLFSSIGPMHKWSILSFLCKGQ